MAPTGSFSGNSFFENVGEFASGGGLGGAIGDETVGEPEKGDDNNISSNSTVEEQVTEQQCFLLEVMNELAEENCDKVYENFIQLRGDPSAALNKLSFRNNVEELLKIKHEEISGLEPYIRFYKCFPPNVTEGDGEECYRIPFPDHVAEGNVDAITNFTKGKDDSISNDEGRVHGAGLKEFSWTQKAQNMAETSNNIDATLKLHFSSIKELKRVYKLENEKNPDKKRNFRFVDLIAPLSKVKETKQTRPLSPREFNSNYFQLKVEVGWSAPPSSEISDTLRRVLQSNRKILNLTLKDHEIQFEQNGVVSLTANYQAFTNGSMLSPDSNILEVDEFAKANIEQANEREEKIKDLEKEIDKLKNWMNKDENEHVTKEQFNQVFYKSGISGNRLDHVVVEEDGGIRDPIQKLEKVIDRIRDDIAVDKTIVYSKFFDKLLVDGRVFRRQVDPRFLGVKDEKGYFGVDMLFGGPEKMTEEEKEEFNLNAESALSGDATQVGSADEEANVVDSEIEKTQTGDEGSEREAMNIDGTIGKLNKSEDGKVPITYFYLGDLFDIVLEEFVNTDQIGHNTKFVLGDMEYILPDITEEQRKYLVNIADIPISLDKFKSWFFDTIIKPQKTKYVLKYFLEDMLTNLVKELLSPECFGGKLSQKFRPASSLFTLPVSDNPSGAPSHDPMTVADTGANITGADTHGEMRLFEKTIDGEKVGELRRNGTVEDSVSYVMFFARNIVPSFRVANEEEDIKEGIYHFSLGNDKGLVREMDFQRNDQPYMRESRIEEAGQGQFSRLREHYQCDLRLHGNALFQPGMFVFLNPSVVGFGTPAVRGRDDSGDKIKQPLGQIIGLLGYYHVQKVENVIAPGNYETTLKLEWQAHGDGSGMGEMSGKGRETIKEVRQKPPIIVCRQRGKDDPINDNISIHGGRSVTQPFVED